MSRIELPATDMEMQDLVDRYGPTATVIGINQARAQRLNGFVDEYIGSDAEDLYLTIDGTEHCYPQKMISGVTVRGDIFHTRLHEAAYTVDKSIQNIVVVESLFSDDPAEYWAAEAVRREGFNLVHRTDITTSRIVGYGRGLRSVGLEDDNGDEEYDSGTQRLERALARLALPQIRHGNANREYRTGLEAYDTFHDVLDIQKKVTELRVELGVTAAKAVALEPQYELQPTGSDE